MIAVQEDPRPTALVVDDDGILRMDVADILERVGFRTLEAEDGDEAMTMLEQHHLDISLLFSDVEMLGSWPVGRRLEAAGDVFPDSLAVHPGLSGDDGDGQTLSMQVEDHYEFLEIEHRAVSSRWGGQHRRDRRSRPAETGLRQRRGVAEPGNIQSPDVGSIQRPLTGLAVTDPRV